MRLMSQTEVSPGMTIVAVKMIAVGNKGRWWMEERGGQRKLSFGRRGKVRVTNLSAGLELW